MKLTIAKGELQRGLARIQSIVEKRNTMPILANVFLRADRGGDASSLELAATDLEVGIRSELPAQVEEAGAVTVSAKKIFEIIRELPEEPVHLATTENHYLEVECARARFVLAGTAADEYPTLPGASETKAIHIQAALLSSMIECTLYAASLDETRYNLNGVLFELPEEPGRIRMVATDGHRLAYAERTVAPELEGLENNVIIPRKGLAEIKRLVDEEDADEVELGFAGNSGVLRKGAVTLMMRLIEGEFPNYQQVLPKSLDRHLVLPTEPLIHALRRVSLLSAERTRAVKLELSSGTLAVSSNNPDLGEAREELDVDFEGDEVSIGFNARYLLDALAALGAKEVELGLHDAVSPVQLRATDDSGSLAVVMPMRL